MNYQFPVVDLSGLNKKEAISLLKGAAYHLKDGARYYVCTAMEKDNILTGLEYDATALKLTERIQTTLKVDNVENTTHFKASFAEAKDITRREKTAYRIAWISQMLAQLESQP